jgi:hypothetical protein
MRPPFDSTGNLNQQEYIPEEFADVHQHNEHYLWVDWYAVDPEPSVPMFNTNEGPCPKHLEFFEDVQCVRTDFSIISLS